MGMITRALALLLGTLLAGAAVAQDEVHSYTSKAPFDEVEFELSNAIIARGLIIEYTGDIGRMLERTGPDVGSVKPLYNRAKFMMFCSAKLSRAMMEADPRNIAFCPYVVFLYEPVAHLGETVVGYRRPLSIAASSSSPLADVDALLDGIVRDAVK
jgi:uncharacterized protein (DUF302 family)